MEFISLTKALTDIAASFFGSAEKLRSMEKDKIIRTAQGLTDIADCIEGIVKGIEKNDWSILVQRCQELAIYLNHFNSLKLGPVLGDSKTDLLEELEEAAAFRRSTFMASKLEHVSEENRADSLNALRQAAGTFRASSNILRATA